MVLRTDFFVLHMFLAVAVQFKQFKILGLIPVTAPESAKGVCTCRHFEVTLPAFDVPDVQAAPTENSNHTLF